MDALAQDAADSALQAPDEVWGIVHQWPILLLFLAGFGLAYYIFVHAKKNDAPAPTSSTRLAALLATAERLSNSPPGLNVDIGRIEAMFDTIDAKLESINDKVDQVDHKVEVGMHALEEHTREDRNERQTDRDTLSDIRERLARVEGSREPWTDEEHQKRTRSR